MTSTPTAAVDPDTLERCLSVLGHRPSAVITDIDGTISAIAPTPADALVTDVAREALTALADRLALVGVVTGRSAAVGEAMVAVPGLVYIGNHGMERVHKGVVWHHPGAVAKADAIGAALREIGAEAATEDWFDGVVIEDKRLSGSVHYRLVPDSAPARDVLLRLANEAAARHDLLVTEGRQIVELRPRIVVNKGTAIRGLVEEFGLGGLIFLGDDLTDVDAFREVRVLREEGRIEGLRVAVLAAETQPEVFAESDVTVKGVGACVALLAAIADAVAFDDGHGANPG
jgi:trehalose 6-phosphate phosphatase